MPYYSFYKEHYVVAIVCLKEVYAILNFTYQSFSKYPVNAKKLYVSESY